MANVVVITQIMFIMNPVDAMSLGDMVDAAYAIAFGGLATGDMNAQEQVITDDNTKISLSELKNSVLLKILAIM